MQPAPPLLTFAALMKIGIFFGGTSREREISFAGGRTVFDNLDKALFQPVPIFVDSLGQFILLDWQYIYKGTIRDFYPPVSVAAAFAAPLAGLHRKPGRAEPRGAVPGHCQGGPAGANRRAAPADGLRLPGPARARAAKTAPFRACWSGWAFRTRAPAFCPRPLALIRLRRRTCCKPWAGPRPTSASSRPRSGTAPTTPPPSPTWCASWACRWC